MFQLYANKTQLTVRAREPLTSGMLNTAEARFEFSPDWEGLTKTAVFKAGNGVRSVLLGEDSQCVIPWEVLSSHGRQLTAGVCGTRGTDMVLPTVWVNLGTILEGAAPGENARLPTPDLWEQELAGKVDRIKLDGLTLKLLSGTETLSQVELPPPGGGEGGTTDHRLLTGRNAGDQHPVEAITGLGEALEAIPRPMTADELRKILSGGTRYANNQHQRIP